MIGGDDLRDVMRLIPAPVAVVTVDLEGERVGLTVASLVSLSLDPPLVGVAVRRTAALHELLRRAGEFGVSVLAAGQEHLAQHFARGVPPIALWKGIPLRARGRAAAARGRARLAALRRPSGARRRRPHALRRRGAGGRGGSAGPALVYLDRRYVSA